MMGGNRKQKVREVPARIAALVCSLCLLLPILVEAGTTIDNIRLGSHSEYTRLVFDSTGDRPSNIGSPSDGGLTIRYGELKAGSLLPKKYESSSSLVTGITLKNGSEIFITFRNAGTTVKTEVLNAAPPQAGRYRLIMDFSSKPGTPAETPLPPAEKGRQGSGKE